MDLNFPKFEELTDIVKKAIKKGTIEKFRWGEQLSGSGIEIKINEIIFGESLVDPIYAIDPETGNIRKIVLYISQRKEALINKWGFPKYHLFYCETMEQYKSKIHQKYKISSRQDGLFYFISLPDDNTKPIINEEQPLEFCGNCIRIYNDLFKEHKTKKNFDIEKFFSTDLSSFYDDGCFKYDYDTIPNVYSNNWREIATKVKIMKKYICEKCYIDLKKEKQFLHAHHKDGKKYNNQFDNIQVLCIKCHSEEQDHGHIKATNDYKLFMKLAKDREEN